MHEDKGEDSMVQAARYAAVGFEFAGMAVAGILAGSWLDERFGTLPLFTLLLTVGGLCGAVYRLLLTLRTTGIRKGDGR